MSENKKKLSERTLGILCIISAAFCFALMTFFVKLSGDIPTYEKAFFRNCVAVIFSLVIILKSKTKFEIPKAARINVIGRSIFGTVGIFGNFYAISKLNIADASMLNKLSPFFAIIFSFFLLKEKVKPFQIYCVITAFVGALLILQPSGESLTFFPALIGLLGGAAAGFAYTNVRIASSKGCNGPIIVFCFSLFSTLFSVPFIIAGYAPISSKQLVFLLLAGLSATGGQFSITAAYSHAPAKEISVYDYTQVIFAAILGFIFLNEIPNYLSFIGYIIIIGAGIVMYLKNKSE